MPDEKIEISRFNFRVITTLFGSLVLGIGTWATSINSQMVQGQIAMAEVKAMVTSIDNRLEENLEATNRIHKLESDLRALSVSVDINQQDLLKRITRLEHQIQSGN